ncbi:glycosyltransferase [Flavobacterium piscinae]|uniref:Glycosyltransferase n=1 Tax=Flavobacterium piscinae TaxID=2506424 RepID=A0A4Q1KSM5_9FLAO|nr:glycosyltransferase family 4 protein [Flavobacterium piscinae]RXR33077.1 glycosyltransferase [Flavobacterium piscinae]
MIKTNNKILVVVTTFPSITETFIINQITDLIDKGYKVTVFSYVKPKNQPIHQIFEDYNLHDSTVTHFKNEGSKWEKIKAAILFYTKHFLQINHYRMFSLLNPLKIKTNSRKIKVYYDLPILLFKKKFDIIHCHFGFNAKKVADAFELKLCSHSKAVVSFHGSDLTPSKVDYYKSLYRGVFIHFDAFITNSVYLQNILLLVNPTITKNYIIPVGFKETYLKKHLIEKPKDNIFNIVFCGRLINWKGPDRAIKMVYQMMQKKCENVVLHIIGNGEMIQELKELARKLNITANIVFYGAINQENVFKIMANGSVFLYPGIEDKTTKRSETQGLVLQEAQYFKLPIITSDVGGIKYGIVPNETGFLISNEKEEEFVEKLILLYNNPKLRMEMGEKGHKFVLNEFESNIIGQKLIKVYASI